LSLLSQDKLKSYLYKYEAEIVRYERRANSPNNLSSQNSSPVSPSSSSSSSSSSVTASVQSSSSSSSSSTVTTIQQSVVQSTKLVCLFLSTSLFPFVVSSVSFLIRFVCCRNKKKRNAPHNLTSYSPVFTHSLCASFCVCSIHSLSSLSVASSSIQDEDVLLYIVYFAVFLQAFQNKRREAIFLYYLYLYLYLFGELSGDEYKTTVLDLTGI
jgi:hypothetical protein